MIFSIFFLFQNGIFGNSRILDCSRSFFYDFSVLQFIRERNLRHEDEAGEIELTRSLVSPSLISKCILRRIAQWKLIDTDKDLVIIILRKAIYSK